MKKSCCIYGSNTCIFSDQRRFCSLDQVVSPGIQLIKRISEGPVYRLLKMHEVLDLKVIYADGQPDDIAVQHFIRAGERTRPADLKGWERAIDRVDFVYRTALNPVEMIARQRISTTTVCVEGLQ
jgi:hypothetical protein